METQKESNICLRIQEELLGMQDLKYKAFHSRLMPTIQPERIIGVRTPALRKFSSELTKKESKSDLDIFLHTLPHYYYEENNLHAFLVEKIKDFDECVTELERFLPFVDNWATCDMMAPKVLGKKPGLLLGKITEWIESAGAYTCRFGIGMLMRFFLDESFQPKYLDMVAQVSSGEYYVNMMRAWFFATAIAKQYDATLPYLTQNRLDAWTHNKTIQKAIESYRVPHERKDFLRSLKVQS